MLDLHCHILPGVDDGAASLQQSAAMLAAARTAGITHIVATPHCRGSHFNPQRIASAYQQLLPLAQSQGLELTLGTEVYWEKLAELGFHRAPDLCLGPSRLLLLEFGCAALPPAWERIVYELQRQGIQVVIAHPERYAPIQRDLTLAYQLKEAGCYLQLSANFMQSGPFGKRKKVAKALLKAGLVDYIASDAHQESDYADFTSALQFAARF